MFCFDAGCFRVRNRTLAVKMFGLSGLFMKENANVPEGRNEGGRVATPTSFLIFDSYDMKSL